jgi:hypothetical protein
MWRVDPVLILRAPPSMASLPSKVEPSMVGGVAVLRDGPNDALVQAARALRAVDAIVETIQG